MNPSRICFFAIFSKDFRKLRSSDVLAILLIAYGHILPKLFEFFKLNIEIAQNIFDCFWDIAENMGFKKSSVSVAMKHLREDDYITVTNTLEKVNDTVQFYLQEADFVKTMQKFNG